MTTIYKDKQGNITRIDKGTRPAGAKPAAKPAPEPKPKAPQPERASKAPAKE